MYSSVNTIWVLFGAALVFFMQAGFAMVETGFTRAKNAGNIIMKNLMDFCIGTRSSGWLVSVSCSVQETGSSVRWRNRLRGKLRKRNASGRSSLLGIPDLPDCILRNICHHRIRCHGRTYQIHLLLYLQFLISLVVYPVSGHWIWGGGFISQMGFHDFAGSCAVHMVGGVAALIGAIILGARIGKYSKSGKCRDDSRT